MKSFNLMQIATFALCLMLTAEPAFAQAIDPVATILNNIITSLTGPVGKAVAVVALIIIGFACYLGRLNWLFFGAWLVATALIFSAEDIVDTFIP